MAAYAALAAQLRASEAAAGGGLEGVRAEVAAARLPALSAQLRGLEAKVAALEGSTLSAGVPLFLLSFSCFPVGFQGLLYVSLLKELSAVQLRCASRPLLIWSRAAAQRCAAAIRSGHSCLTVQATFECQGCG